MTEIERLQVPYLVAWSNERGIFVNNCLLAKNIYLSTQVTSDVAFIIIMSYYCGVEYLIRIACFYFNLSALFCYMLFSVSVLVSVSIKLTEPF